MITTEEWAGQLNVLSLNPDPPDRTRRFQRCIDAIQVEAQIEILEKAADDFENCKMTVPQVASNPFDPWVAAKELRARAKRIREDFGAARVKA